MKKMKKITGGFMSPFFCLKFHFLLQCFYEEIFKRYIFQNGNESNFLPYA